FSSVRERSTFSVPSAAAVHSAVKSLTVLYILLDLLDIAACTTAFNLQYSIKRKQDSTRCFFWVHVSFSPGMRSDTLGASFSIGNRTEWMQGEVRRAGEKDARGAYINCRR